ncbi:MAG: dual specificity protein phosphatase family protein [Acidimicrobiia bacterium]
MSFFTERHRNGGIDEVPVEGASGRLWLCGKHFVGPDPEGALARIEGDVIVCLNEAHEIERRYPGYIEWLVAHQPRRAVWHPIADLHAPDVEDAVGLTEQVRERLVDGEVVLVHCGAGIGRAGTLAVAVLMSMGASPPDALALVAASRPMAGPEAGVQRELIEALRSRW